MSKTWRCLSMASLVILVAIIWTSTQAEKCVSQKLKKSTRTVQCKDAVTLMFLESWQVETNETMLLNQWSPDPKSLMQKVNQGRGLCILYKMFPEEVEACCMGWSGKDCTKATCSKPCMHGICNAPNTCVCEKGWSGSLCDQDLEGSRLSPAMAGDQAVVKFHTCISGPACKVRTFHGELHEHCSHCPLTLLSTVEVKVQTSTECDSERSYQCFEAVTIESILSKRKYQLSNDSMAMFWETQSRPMEVLQLQELGDYPVKLGDLSLDILGDSVRIFMSRTGLHLRRDNYVQVFLTLDRLSPLRHALIEGACASLRPSFVDEFDTTADNDEAVEFRETSAREPCNSLMSICQRSGTGHQASLECDLLYTDLFSACHSVIDVTPYADVCRAANCHAMPGGPDRMERARCTILSAYASACALEHVIIKWRTPELCPPTCPSGMVYQQCGLSCKPTCGHPLSSDMKDECRVCCPGCHCKEGLVFYNHTCMPPTQCPCLHQNRTYQVGTSLALPETCQECTCGQNGQWNCKASPCLMSCSVYGTGFVQTFDGEEFLLGSEQHNCDFTLLTTTTMDLEIKLLTKPCGETKGVVCARGFDIYVEQKEKIRVQVDSSGRFSAMNLLLKQIVDLPYLTNAVYVRHLTTTSVAADIRDIRVVLFAQNYLTVSTKQSLYYGNIRGLCGNLNNLIDDDRLLLSGVEAPTDNIFVATFSDERCGYIPAPRQETFNVPRCLALKQFYEDFNQTEDSVTSVYRACVYNDDDSNICSALLRLANTVGVSVLSMVNKKGQNFNVSQRCLSSLGLCDEGFQYREDIEVCQTNCLDLQYKGTCPAMKLQGCACAAGYFRSPDDRCVPASECPCLDMKTNQYRQPGPVSGIIPCQECICQKGQLWCEEKGCEDIICPSDQRVVTLQMAQNSSCLRAKCPDKYSNQMTCANYSNYQSLCVCAEGFMETWSGVCVPRGDCPCYFNDAWHASGSHVTDKCYQKQCMSGRWHTVVKTQCEATCYVAGSRRRISTFDGATFSFAGPCAYTLLQTRGPGQGFKVVSRSLMCGDSETACSHIIEISFRGIHLQLVKGVGVLHGNKSYSFDEQVTVGEIQIMSTTLYTVVSFEDIAVYWSGGLLTWIQVSSRWENKLEGLCGTYDYNSRNDFLRSDGSLDTNPSTFGLSWEEKDVHCTDGIIKYSNMCEAHPERRRWAEFQCSIIRTADVFTFCREMMPQSHLNRFVSDCEQEACSCNRGGDCECLCDAIAHFESVCNSLGRPARWRHQHLCPVQCEKGKVYSPDGSVCQRTCLDLSLNSSTCDFPVNVEGCFCPMGQVLHESKCIPVDQCPCYDGQYVFSPGTVLAKDCKNCICQQGVFHCSEVPCPACAASDFQCVTTRNCISKSQVCNNVFDCFDGSDETQTLCGNIGCTESQFQCLESGECIPKSELCDGIGHCWDKSDEDDQQCPPVCEFRCKGGSCLYASNICDGFADCPEGDDEMMCNTGLPLIFTAAPSRAGKKNWKSTSVKDELQTTKPPILRKATSEVPAEYFSTFLVQRETTPFISQKLSPSSKILSTSLGSKSTRQPLISTETKSSSTMSTRTLSPSRQKRTVPEENSTGQSLILPTPEESPSPPFFNGQSLTSQETYFEGSSLGITSIGPPPTLSEITSYITEPVTSVEPTSFTTLPLTSTEATSFTELILTSSDLTDIEDTSMALETASLTGQPQGSEETEEPPTSAETNYFTRQPLTSPEETEFLTEQPPDTRQPPMSSDATFFSEQPVSFIEQPPLTSSETAPFSEQPLPPETTSFTQIPLEIATGQPPDSPETSVTEEPPYLSETMSFTENPQTSLYFTDQPLTLVETSFTDELTSPDKMLAEISSTEQVLTTPEPTSFTQQPLTSFTDQWKMSKESSFTRLSVTSSEATSLSGEHLTFSETFFPEQPSTAPEIGSSATQSQTSLMITSIAEQPEITYNSGQPLTSPETVPDTEQPRKTSFPQQELTSVATVPFSEDTFMSLAISSFTEEVFMSQQTTSIEEAQTSQETMPVTRQPLAASSVGETLKFPEQTFFTEPQTTFMAGNIQTSPSTEVITTLISTGISSFSDSSEHEHTSTLPSTVATSDCVHSWTSWSKCQPKPCKGVRVRTRHCDTDNPMCACEDQTLRQAQTCICVRTTTPTTSQSSKPRITYSTEPSSTKHTMTTVTHKSQITASTTIACHCKHPTKCIACFDACKFSCRAYRSQSVCRPLRKCQTGCICPHGQLMDDHEFCNIPRNCPCYDSTGVEHPFNSTYLDTSSCKVCVCKESGSVCRDQGLEFEMYYVWASWSSWSECSNPCGHGTTTRYRNGEYRGCRRRQEESRECTSQTCYCVTPHQERVKEGKLYKPDQCTFCTCQKNGSLSCIHDLKSVVDGSWETWSAWTPCEKNCKLYQQNSCRYCKPPVCGGKPCQGPRVRTQPCGSNPCYDMYIWSEWSLCSQSCGPVPGRRSRYRIYPEGISKNMSKEIGLEKEECGLCPCPGNIFVHLTTWSEWTSCKTKTANCGWGKRTRLRSISQQCRVRNVTSQQTEDCYLGPCKCTNGQEWTNHTSCQRSCDTEAEPGCKLHLSGGCACPQHLVFNGTNCIPLSDCPDGGCVYNTSRYQNGEVFPCNKCSLCRCCQGQRLRESKTCPEVTKCNLTSHCLVPSQDGCCLVECAPQETCRLHKQLPQFITIGNCRSAVKVEQEICKGPCPISSQVIDYSLKTVTSQQCFSCSADITLYRPVEFICDNMTQTVHYLPIIGSCHCQQ